MQEKRHDCVVEMRLCFFSVKVGDYKVSLVALTMCRSTVGEEYPIIILTAYEWSDVEQEARETGVTAFVSKPLFLSELREVLMSQAQRELLKNEKQNAQAKKRE